MVYFVPRLSYIFLIFNLAKLIAAELELTCLLSEKHKPIPSQEDFLHGEVTKYIII